MMPALTLMPPIYADIAIDLDPFDDDAFLVKLRAPDGGETRTTFKPPTDAAFVDLLKRYVIDDLNAVDAMRLGQILFEALFPPRARDLFMRGLSYAEQQGERPRLLLTIPLSAHIAATLPWELLHDPAGSSLVHRGLSVVRRIPLDRTLPRRLDAARLRVLLTAAPVEPLADVERELAAVYAALDSVASQCDLVIEPRLTCEILQRRLRDDFHAWHHVGHGRDDGSLVLLDDLGDPYPVTSQQLAALLSGSALRLAAFSACDSGRFDASGGLVEALSNAGVPTIIAMQRRVTAETTRTFASELYRALAEGWNVTAAVDEGRRALLGRTDARPDWTIPVVYSRLPDEALFVRPGTVQALEMPELRDIQRMLQRGDCDTALDRMGTFSAEQLVGQPVLRQAADLIERLDIDFAVRERAAKLAARAGDPRPGVTSLEPAWCKPIPAGRYPLIDGTTVELGAFQPARYPVTVAQYRRFWEAGGYYDETWWTPNGRAFLYGDIPHTGKASAPFAWTEARFTVNNAPVVGVSWYEAMAFCAWLTAELDLPIGSIRLLTEAEWEIAAFWHPDKQQLREPVQPAGIIYNLDAARVDAPSPVGLYGIPAAGGAHDMAGNVWEWCATHASQYPADAAVPRADMKYDDNGPALRGASWAYDERVSPWRARWSYYSYYQTREIGFRVCLIHSGNRLASV